MTWPRGFKKIYLSSPPPEISTKDCVTPPASTVPVTTNEVLVSKELPPGAIIRATAVYKKTSAVYRLKLKGNDERAPPGVEPEGTATRNTQT